MTFNLDQSNAANDVINYLTTGRTHVGTPITRAQAIEGLAILADGAYKRLSAGLDGERARKLLEEHWEDQATLAERVTQLEARIATFQPEFAYRWTEYGIEETSQSYPTLADALEASCHGSPIVQRFVTPWQPFKPEPVDEEAPAAMADAVQPHDEQLTPEAWCERYGLEVRDPDGWRSKGAPAWEQPITLADFWQRFIRSTGRGLTGDVHDRIVSDVRAASAQIDPPADENPARLEQADDESVDEEPSASPAETEQPFDHTLPQRLDEFIAAFQAKAASDPDAAVSVVATGDYRFCKLTLGDLLELRARLAFRQQEAEQLAEKCAGYRAQIAELETALAASKAQGDDE